MLIDVEDGFAPREWQSYVGPVLAYRPQIGGQSVQHFNSKHQCLVFLSFQTIRSKSFQSSTNCFGQVQLILVGLKSFRIGPNYKS